MIKNLIINLRLWLGGNFTTVGRIKKLVLLNMVDVEGCYSETYNNLYVNRVTSKLDFIDSRTHHLDGLIKYPLHKVGKHRVIELQERGTDDPMVSVLLTRFKGMTIRLITTDEEIDVMMGILYL